MRGQVRAQSRLNLDSGDTPYVLLLWPVYIKSKVHSPSSQEFPEGLPSTCSLSKQQAIPGLMQISPSK